jgi:hypothetical protein
MKCIKVGNQIASLENVMSVGIGSTTDSIRIEYTHGHIIPSSQVFCHHNTQLRYVQNTDKVINDIFEILSKNT